MALRFGRYLFEFYSILSQRKDIDLLPAIFPILIYNGDNRWTACDNIKDIIIPSIDKQYIPNFRYYKIIENEIPKKTLLKIGNALSAVFYVENCSMEEIKSSINELTSILEKEQPELVSLFKDWFNNMLETAGVNSDEAGETVGKLNRLLEVGTMFTTAIKEHAEKHEQIGLKKGRKEEKIENTVKMIKLGMATELISEVTGLSAAEIESLRASL